MMKNLGPGEGCGSQGWTGVGVQDLTGKGECGKVNTKGPERESGREAWEEVGGGEDARELGRLGVTARRRKVCPGQGSGPKGNRWVCPTQAVLTPALKTVPVLQSVPKALRTWDTRALRSPGAPELG